MGKRSDFEKIGKSQYFTPEAAFLPLLPFLPKGGFYFAEPCAGDGRLACYVHAHTNGRATLLSDIDPEGAKQTAENFFGGAFRDDVVQRDAFDITESDLKDVDMVITNPPWERAKKDGYILHRLIEHFGRMRPTWFLFDADWAHTVQAEPYLRFCTHIVSVGRVKWFDNQSGKDNAAWYHFHPEAERFNRGGPTFYGRGIHP